MTNDFKNIWAMAAPGLKAWNTETFSVEQVLFRLESQVTTQQRRLIKGLRTEPTRPTQNFNVWRRDHQSVAQGRTHVRPLASRGLSGCSVT